MPVAKDIFTLEALQAKHGDALLLHYGTADAPRLIIIDGGPAGVFKSSLSPRLEEIRTRRGGRQLEVRMVIVSHIDDDHIAGVLDLTKSLRKLQAEGDALPYDILTLWHNSFDDLIAKMSAKGQSAVKGAAASIAASFGDANRGGGSKKQLEKDEPPNVGRAVAASVNQGRELRANADALALNLNSGFDDLITFEGPGQSEISIGAGLEFTIIGPRKEQIDDLQKMWAAFLRKKLAAKRKGKGKKKAKAKAKAKGKSSAKKKAAPASLSEPLEAGDFEAGIMSAADIEQASAAELEGAVSATELEAIAAEFVDESVPNLSSIVILAKFGAHSMLLTGDARGDFVVESLKEAKLLKNGTIHVDVLKVPHHGSERNMEESFFKTVTADHYVFSANGTYGNPDPPTFEMLFAARPTDEYTLWLTNPVPAALKTIKKHKRNKLHVEVREDPALSRKIELATKIDF
jgi:beta-lactamase superfamily II metal-dependent hydrolase